MPEFVLPDGERLTYEDHGAGRSVVLVHGLWMSGRFWRSQVPLAEDVRLVVPDLRGHGRSSSARHGHTVAQYARDVIALLDHLDLDDVLLCGWSMGGHVVWEVLRQREERGVAGVAIVGEPAAEFAWPDWAHPITTLDELVAVNRWIQEMWPTVVQEFLPSMFAAPPAPDELAWMAAENLRVEPATASAIFVDQTFADARDLLAGVRVPVRILWGEQDRVAPIAGGEQLLASLRNARLERFADAAHCPHLEQPDKFNAAVLRFVADLDDGSQ